MLYHGTDGERAEEDINNFNRHIFKINILNIENALKRKQKLPGSLGYGYYTFENDKKLATEFAKKKYSKPQVIKVELAENINEDNILDFLDSEKESVFIDFANSVENDKVAKKLMDAFKHKRSYISNNQDVFAGIMTELFIKYMKRYQHQAITIVRKKTESYVNLRTSYKYRLGLYNGIEVCIRDSDCIKSMRM